MVTARLRIHHLQDGTPVTELVDDAELLAQRCYQASQLMLRLGLVLLDARKREYDEAIVDLEIAADRVRWARWRLLLHCGRLRRAGKIAAIAADQVVSTVDGS